MIGVWPPCRCPNCGALHAEGQEQRFFDLGRAIGRLEPALERLRRSIGTPLSPTEALAAVMRRRPGTPLALRAAPWPTFSGLRSRWTMRRLDARARRAERPGRRRYRRRVTCRARHLDATR